MNVFLYLFGFYQAALRYSERIDVVILDHPVDDIIDMTYLSLQQETIVVCRTLKLRYKAVSKYLTDDLDNLTALFGQYSQALDLSRC